MTEPSEARFRIGEVAAQAGVSPRTLRYYQSWECSIRPG